MNRTCLSNVKGTKPLPWSCKTEHGQRQETHVQQQRLLQYVTGGQRGGWEHNQDQRDVQFGSNGVRTMLAWQLHSICQ